MHHIPCLRAMSISYCFYICLYVNCLFLEYNLAYDDAVCSWREVFDYDVGSNQARFSSALTGVSS